MSLHLEKLIPTWPEVVLLSFVALLLSFLGNVKDLLNQWGLVSTAHTIGNTASMGIGDGLSKLDSYQATANIITFMVWALIGLLTLSIIQALAHLLQEVNYEKNVGSNAYVHPTNFNRKGFWSKLLVQSLISFIVFVVASTYLILFCLYILPVGLIYTKVLLSSFSISNIPYWLIGFAILLVGLLGIDLMARLVRFRHNIFT